MNHTPTSVYASAEQLEWVEAKPGIHVKVLYEDPARGERTVLTRMDPGARSTPHCHDEFEQVHVISGGFHDGERALGPGDHCWRPAGTMHEAFTRDGALVLVVYTRQ